MTTACPAPKPEARARRRDLQSSLLLQHRRLCQTHRQMLLLVKLIQHLHLQQLLGRLTHRGQRWRGAPATHHWVLPLPSCHLSQNLEALNPSLLGLWLLSPALLWSSLRSWRHVWLCNQGLKLRRDSRHFCGCCCHVTARQQSAIARAACSRGCHTPCTA